MPFPTLVLLHRILLLAALFSTASSCLAQAVKLTEVQWHGTGCYRIEMPLGTVYFEKDKGVSGFKSFVDPEGRDWIASYLPPGPKGEYRGFPNSVGNFGHAGRDSGSRTSIVGGITEGDRVILESSNTDFCFQYWFFPDRIVVKVLRSKGEYCFLLECVAGGSAEAEDYFVSADGTQHSPRGEFADFSPEWIYLGDPKSKHYLLLGKSPEDEAPNENHRQVLKGAEHNMDLYSFGRTGASQKYQIKGMVGNEHICVISFIGTDKSHAQIRSLMERWLSTPFSP